MSDERADEGVRGVGNAVRLPPAAPPRRESPAPRSQPQPAAAERGPAGPSPAAAQAAALRGALGQTVAQFIIDPTSYDVSIRLIDLVTRTVVREIPPGDLIALARSSGVYQGILVNQRV